MLTINSAPASVPKAVLIFMKSEPFAQSLRKALETTGYRITAVNTESAIITEAKANAPSLIIIDRHSGAITSLRKLRGLNAVPIVAVQESGVPCVEEECIQEYEQDVDLVVYNQSVRELVARTRAILRRQNGPVDSHTHFSVGHIHMDLDRHEVKVNDRAVDLTPKEFQILRQFLESPSRVFSRQEMLNRVWGEGYALEEHALDVHIYSLRQKIEQNPARPKCIVTVRGIGYKLRA